MIKISPSLLSADMARLADAVNMVKDEADYIHCDVMDGHFVPNLTFGAPVVKALKKISPLPLDVHLMIENPGRWIIDYINACLDENDFLIFHIEAEENADIAIKQIRSAGIRPGLSIKPGTPFEKIIPMLDLIDQILIMTVEPGFGNQRFMKNMIPKIQQAKKMKRLHQIIAIDGGINIETAPLAVCAGADLLVAGGAVFGTKDPVQAIRDIRALTRDVDC